MSDFKEFWKNPNRKDGLTICRGSIPVTIVELEYLAELLLEWLEKEDAITAESFHLNKNIASNRWHDWCKRCPELQEAWDIAVERIGERRERRGLTGAYNSRLVEATMPLYKKSFREWKLQERKMSESEKQTIIVMRDRFPETDAVEPRAYEGAE